MKSILKNKYGLAEVGKKKDLVPFLLTGLDSEEIKKGQKIRGALVSMNVGGYASKVLVNVTRK
ncbi:MAG: hypothetical protein HKN16_12515 [Saprospiraceae bacterium]|nr:hypothetical protein [Saprospiraceae bacterium]